MTLEEKLSLLISIGEETTTKDDLKKLLTSQKKLIAYDGFEPSGQMHIAQGIVRAINTNKMIQAGFTFRMWVADWFAYLNNKMGGDLARIQNVGTYFIEIWRASGMNLKHTEFLWTSDFVGDRGYWETVMKVAKSSTLKRILRTTEIMGRDETDTLSGAQIMYPCMQIADIFYAIEASVTQLGMDQRKVNMLAREVGKELGFWKPVVISNHMLMGLGKPTDEVDAVERAIQMKMSKSKPDSAIFMTDSKKDIHRKIMKAYCPEGDIQTNPILEYCKYIIFEAHHLKGQEEILKHGFQIHREEKNGGDISFQTYVQLQKAFQKKEIHPMDLKLAVIEYLDRLISPVRMHFETNPKAKALLNEIRSYTITR